jgi:hypothetical protein
MKRAAPPLEEKCEWRRDDRPPILQARRLRYAASSPQADHEGHRCARRRAFFALRIFVLVAWFCLADAAFIRAQEPAPGYTAFRMVRTRNIFDPDRRPGRSENSSRPQTTTAASRSNFIALTGTMVSEGRALAFFAGSQSDYHKVIGESGTIADFKIARVTPKGVELVRDGKSLTVEVGRQVLLDGAGGETTVVAPIDAGALATPVNGEPAPGRSPAEPGVPGDKSDLLKRMMERRQQEMSK